jgi:hypothetical protein
MKLLRFPLYGAIASVLLTIAILLRLNCFIHLGGLWRDEVHSADVASHPDFGVWEDSFPTLWIVFLRSWIAVFGMSDESLRFAGFLNGIAVLPAAWWATQARGRGIPWATLCFFALNSSAVYYGTEVRGYSLGVMLQLLFMGTALRVILRPTPRLRLIFPIISLLCVQAAFPNWFVLAGITTVGATFLLFAKRWRDLTVFCGNAALCALSVVPIALLYVTNDSSSWAAFVRHEYSVAHLAAKLVATLSNGSAVAGPLWGVAVAGTFAAVLLLPRATGPYSSVRFLEPAILVAVSGLLFIYFWVLRVATFNWYHLPVLATWAFCIDSTWPGIAVGSRGRACIALCALAMAAVQIPSTWRISETRITNVDLAARAASHCAGKGDLVVITPWLFAPGYLRYGFGPATVTTMPRITDTRVRGVITHPEGYAAIGRAIQSDRQVDDELEAVRQTLLKGRNVFIVCDAHFPSSRTRVRFPKPSDGSYPLSAERYQAAWESQLYDALVDCGSAMTTIPLASAQRIHGLEKCVLLQVSGRPAKSRTDIHAPQP